jgi:transposase
VNFAEMTGILAQTDKLDAQVIAYYGDTMKPSLTELKPENQDL